MTNKEMVKQMVKVFGFNSVMEMVEAVRDEIREEDKKYAQIICPYEYSNVGRQNNKDKIIYPDWVNETFDRVVKQTGVSVYEYGSNGTRSLHITHSMFAKYIIYAANDNGITFNDVLEILMAAPAWCRGQGITRQRMELVFHLLMLHRDNRGKVKTELKVLLNKYDPVALKVFANADDDYRHTLNYEAKMIAFAEKKICEVINATTLFKVA